MAVVGREAVDLVEAVPYDRVFMDVPTPELDGLEVTAEIRRCEGEHDRRLPREALPCDLDDLARNYDDDPDAIRSLLEMFLPRATELVERMESAARRGDHEALRRDAHALRGISGTVRAQRLFARLERDATELDLSAVAHELGQVRDYLERELGLRMPA